MCHHVIRRPSQHLNWISNNNVSSLFLCFILFISHVEVVYCSWWYLAVIGGVHQPGQPSIDTSSTSSFPDRPSDSPLPLQERCNSLPFLNSDQKHFCSKSPDIPRLVALGAQWGIQECQHQFKHRRWNCTTHNDTSLFGKVLDINGREKAYIYAIASAGVMVSVTKACARGQLDICGCDRPGNEGGYPPASRDEAGLVRRIFKTVGEAPQNTSWQWGGCSHDVKFGARFTRKFIDSMENRMAPEGQMNLWNNRVGRRLVKRTLRRLCKCHGVSGACSIQVCWRIVSDLREISSHLLILFEDAKKVQVHRKKRLRLIMSNGMSARPSRDSLVYMEDSPNYCHRNPMYGSYGTSGRECFLGPPGIAGHCQDICCDRRYYRKVETTEVDCDCKFVWCCNVVCKKCSKTVDRYFCT